MKDHSRIRYKNPSNKKSRKTLKKQNQKTQNSTPLEDNRGKEGNTWMLGGEKANGNGKLELVCGGVAAVTCSGGAKILVKGG
jgi:hypothetical protein